MNKVGRSQIIVWKKWRTYEVKEKKNNSWTHIWYKQSIEKSTCWLTFNTHNQSKIENFFHHTVLNGKEKHNLVLDTDNYMLGYFSKIKKFKQYLKIYLL